VQGRAASPLDPEFRRSFGAIARTLGVGTDAVRSRVRRFHESGFIAGWRTVVNPNLVGGQEYVITLHVPASGVERFLDTARLLPGTFMITRFHGTLVGLIFREYDERSARRRIELIEKLAGAERAYASRIPFPPCPIVLIRTDRAILQALRRDPRRRIGDIAKEVGVNARTVRRRLERLSREAAYFALPSLHPRALEGALMAHVRVEYPAARKREIDERLAASLEPQLWHVFHLASHDGGATAFCIYNLVVPSVAGGREALRRAVETPGVTAAWLELYEDFETLVDAIDEEMDRRLGGPLVAAESRAVAARVS